MISSRSAYAHKAVDKIKPRAPEPCFLLGMATMAKAETIAIIRSVVAASGIALVREGSDGPVQRFQGHALRVSGAQFLSR